MNTSRHVRTLTLSLAATGLLVAGCGNGLVTSSDPGQQPSLDTPGPVASASPSPDPDDGDAGGSSPSPSASPADDDGGSGTGGTSGDDSDESDDGDDPDPGSSEPAPTASGSSGGSDDEVAACTTGALELGVDAADGGGAAGSSYAVISYRNASDSPCSLRGYAGVSLVGDGDGTQLGAAAERAPGEVRTIVLIPNDTDSELLQIANAGNFDADECAPTTADGLRIYPPGNRDAAYVPFEVQACQASDALQLTVSPVGTSG